MKTRKTITFTDNQLEYLVRRAKELTVSLSELLRRIVDEHRKA
jgi:predicted CopG family antitoxin